MADMGRIAAFIAPNEPFQIKEVPVPEPEAGAILVKIGMSNICGSDLHMWKGEFSTGGGLGGELPTVLGHEMVGTIAKLGEGVTADANGEPLEIGDRVIFSYCSYCGRCRNCVRGRRVSCLNLRMAMLENAERWPHFVGGYGDYYYVRPGGVIYKVPNSIPDEVGAGANCALSQVIYGLDRVDLRFGETIVIQGAGGLGLYAAAVAKARGAHLVIAIDGVEERLALAKEFGADETVNFNEFPESRSLVKEVRKLTGGYGADVVAELVGHPSVIPEGIKMLGLMGRYLEIGNIKAGVTYEADPSRLVMANKSIIGVSLYEPYALGEAVKFLDRMQGQLPFDKMFATNFALEDINEAFELAERREVVRASIVPGT